MNRSTYSLLLFAALVLSGCNLETVTVAEGKTETKPGPIAAEPAPVTPTPEEPAPTPVVPAPEPTPEPVVPAPEPIPEPVVPAPEPTPEPVVPAPDPEPQPEPVVPAPEPTPEPVVPAPEPEEKHSVQLAWDIPLQRENGAELKPNEISGYKIEYRRVGSTETKTVVIDDGLSDATEITDLAKGLHEFRIAAFDTNGLFSDYSEIASIQVGPNS